VAGPVSSAPLPSRERLRELILGFRVSAALGAAAELGVSDALADGPLTLDQLAAATATDPDTLRRLLRALATVGVYDEHDGSRWANNELSELLCSKVPGTLRPMARTMVSPAAWAAYTNLVHSVRTGQNAFLARHGEDVWSYREQRPELNAVFNQNMAALTSVIADAVTSAYDFSGMSTVVDVGGGEGVLLASVLQRHPHLTGIVFDQEHVVARAPWSAELASRWTAVGGDFFAEVPPADAYLLKWILHDWPDDRCVDILRVCRRGLEPGGVVLVIERLLDRPGHERETAFSDLNMLVMPGGRERTEDEYAALVAAAGLQLTRVVDTGSGAWILEARVA
jgi:hypothetical protein